MQTIDGDEFFGKIKWRAEMIDASVGVFRIRNVVSMNFAAQAEDARSGCKYGIPFGGFRGVFGLAEIRDNDIAQGFRQQSAICPRSPFQFPFIPR